MDPPPRCWLVGPWSSQSCVLPLVPRWPARTVHWELCSVLAPPPRSCSLWPGPHCLSSRGGESGPSSFGSSSAWLERRWRHSRRCYLIHFVPIFCTQSALWSTSMFRLRDRCRNFISSDEVKLCLSLRRHSTIQGTSSPYHLQFLCHHRKLLDWVYTAKLIRLGRGQVDLTISVQSCPDWKVL